MPLRRTGVRYAHEYAAYLPPSTHSLRIVSSAAGSVIIAFGGEVTVVTVPSAAVVLVVTESDSVT